LAAASTTSDPFSLTSVSEDSEVPTFEEFADFGDFQVADGELTPTGGSWSMASDASISSGGSDDAEVVDAERARRDSSPEELRTQTDAHSFVDHSTN